MMFLALQPPAEVVQPPSLPRLSLWRGAYPHGSEPGRGTVVSDALEGALRDQGQWVLFDPENPMGKDTRFLDLPESAIKGRALSTLRGPWLFATRGKQILRQKREGGPWEAWFEAERPFLAFEVLGDERVALIGVETPQPGFPEAWPHTWYMRPGRAKATDTSFVEIWDTTSRSRLHRHEVPEELLALESTLGAFMLQVFTARSQDDLLIYLAETGHLYHLEGQNGKFQRIDTPWQVLEASYLQGLLRGAPRDKSLGTYGDFLPTAMTITPAPGAGFHFSYWDHAFNEGTALRLQKNLPSEWKVLRPVRLPPAPSEGLTPYGYATLHTHTWSPSRRSFQPWKGSTLFDPYREPDWRAEDGNRYLNEIFKRSGAFIAPEGEIQAMRLYLERMRSTHTARTKQPVAKPPAVRVRETERAKEKEQAAAQKPQTPKAPAEPQGPS